MHDQMESAAKQFLAWEQVPEDRKLALGPLKSVQDAMRLIAAESDEDYFDFAFYVSREGKWYVLIAIKQDADPTELQVLQDDMRKRGLLPQAE